MRRVRPLELPPPLRLQVAPFLTGDDAGTPQDALLIVIVRVGLCYGFGFELGRRRYIESLLSPLSRRGRKPAINNVVHYLVGILLVDIRDLLAFLVCHGDRGITR